MKKLIALSAAALSALALTASTASAGNGPCQTLRQDYRTFQRAGLEAQAAAMKAQGEYYGCDTSGW